MRKPICLTFLTFFLATSLVAQDEYSNNNNVIKINVPALAIKNISVQYERAVGKSISVATTFRYMPTSQLPLKRLLAKIADDPEVERQINNLNVGNIALMPELRFYLGKKGALNGFYIGPFISVARYKAELVFEYDDAGTTSSIPMAGDVNAVTGGIMFGAQWKLSNALSLDWWIAGPHYGFSNGDITGKRKLDVREQQLVRDELNELDPPLIKYNYTVDANGATVRFNGPWAGVRSGICIGINF